MAEIKKVRVDGKDYAIGIGEQLGAELEWKLVEVVEYEHAEEDEGVNLSFNLSKPLEKGKTYKIIYVPAGAVDDAYTSILDYANETGEDCYCVTPCVYRSYDSDAGALGMLNYDTNLNSLQILQLNLDDNQYAAGTKLYIYELTIKNVENPSNVVTSNKLNLYTTGTLDEEVQMDNTNIYYKLEKPLQPNKVYYVERHDANMGMYFNCVIRTNNVAQIKCTTRMYACEDNEDTIIFVNVYIIPGGSNTGQVFNISGEHSIYKDTEDTLEIYELPFEF